MQTTAAITTVGLLSVALVAGIASGQGRGGGGGGGGAVGGGPAGGGPAAGGPTSQPGTAVQPQPGVGQPGTTIPAIPQPAVPAQPPGGTSAVGTGVGQPFMTQPAQRPGGGTQVGAGIGSEAGGFGAQPGTANIPQPGAAATDGGGGLSVPSAGGAPVLPGGTSPPSMTGPAPTGAVQAPAPPRVISAPSNAPTAPVASAMTAAMPADAVGVVVESMTLADVIAVDTERGCITLRTLNGDRASYRVDDPVNKKVAVGDEVVIEVARPVFGSAGDAPSASPRMTEPRSAGALRTSSARASTQTEKRTAVSTVTRPAIISRDAIRCDPR